MTIRLYYATGDPLAVADAAAWRAAPDAGLQVVVRFAPPERACRFYRDAQGRAVTVRDRQLWDGQESYDPFGWGAKRGALIADAQFEEIWRRACGDPGP